MKPIKQAQVQKAIIKPLTKKQQGFVKTWLDTGNAVEAAKQNYDTSNNRSAEAMALRLSHDPAILTEVRMALDKHGVTEDWIIEQHKNLVIKSKNDMVKTKNLEDLADYRGMKPRAGAKVEATPQGISVSWGGSEEQ